MTDGWREPLFLLHSPLVDRVGSPKYKFAREEIKIYLCKCGPIATSDLYVRVWENMKIETYVNVKPNIRLFSFVLPFARAITFALLRTCAFYIYLYKKVM